MRPTALAFALALAAAPAAALDLTGAVLETIDAEGYTYLRLDTAVGERWAAVPSTALAKGADVRVEVAASRQDYESKALKRSFDRMIFGTLKGSRAAVTVPERAAIKVDKATGPGARTVAELHALKASLKGKEVRLRAKIVKVTPEVGGYDWIHLRDGTGSAASGDHDLTATTKEVFKPGQTVLVRGRVSVDKDLGGRYKFPIVLEDAKTVR